MDAVGARIKPSCPVAVAAFIQNGGDMGERFAMIRIKIQRPAVLFNGLFLFSRRVEGQAKQIMGAYRVGMGVQMGDAKIGCFLQAASIRKVRRPFQIRFL